MSKDAEFERAIAAGERNREVAERIHNWCGHARVEKAGGAGLIEQQTGLPIGHHAMVCDFAPAGGLASWDLAHSALNFYDHHCKDCDKRQPIGYPNLSDIVGERDRAGVQAAAQRDRYAREAAAALAGRKQLRDALRPGRSAAARALLDDLDALDAGNSGAQSRIVEAATLAPELFDVAIVDYVFARLDAGEAWFAQTGLELICRLAVDGRRVGSAALRCLGKHVAMRQAAAIVQERIADVDETEVGQAIEPLMSLARRPFDAFLGSERPEQPEPLLAVYRRFPAAVHAAVERVLGERHPRKVLLGARVLPVLAQADAAAPARFVRAMAAKLIRAHLLMDENDRFRADDVFRELQDALALALSADPKDTDGLLEAYFNDAAAEGEARIMGAYERLLVTSDRRRLSQESAICTVALRRLIHIATTSSNDGVLRQVQNALRHPPDSLVEAAGTMIDALLGAAALMDSRSVLHEQAGAMRPTADFLEKLERNAELGQLQGIKDAFVHLAAAASAGNEHATQRFVEFLDGVAAEQDGLRSALVEELHTLMVGPLAFSIALPALYAAMVGASTRTRAAAARTLGHLHHRRVADLPALVFEALMPLLCDPYRIVHQSAVGALERIDVPEAFDREVAEALGILIGSYSRERVYPEFLMSCIELLVDRYFAKGIVGVRYMEHLVAIVGKVDPTAAVRELRFVSHHFVSVKGYVELLLHFVRDEQAMHSQADVVIEMLRQLPADAVLAHRREIVAAGLDCRDDHAAFGGLIEILTSAGAWREAQELSEAFAGRMPSTVRMQATKWMALQELAAVRYETAIADGRLGELPAIRQEWERTNALIEKDRQDYAERRHPFESLFTPDEGGGGAREP